AVGAGVIDATLVARAPLVLAVVGEPEIAGLVEDEVVGSTQLELADLVIDALDPARPEINPLDPARDIIGRRGRRNEKAVALDMHRAAIVADIDRAIRPDCRAVRPAADVGDDFRPTVPAARQRPARDLHQDDGAIVHYDGAFREFQALDQDLVIHA